MNIGDIFFALRGDGGPLMVDAQKAANAAGAAAGQTISQRISAGLGKGLGPAAFAGLAVGAVGAYASIQGLTNILGKMTENAIADEESVNRLGASLKTNIPDWNGNTDAIEARIRAGQRLGFSDETLRDSLTVLLGATHDVTKAQEVQATAMDLARFKGVDLQTASEALIKVEAGVYRSLKSLGIVLRDGATQTEALAAVQKVAKGQAEAYANTNRGKLAASQIKVDEAMERFGSVTMPIVVAVTTAAADEIDRLAQAFTDLQAQASDSSGPNSNPDLKWLLDTWNFLTTTGPQDVPIVRDVATATNDIMGEVGDFLTFWDGLGSGDWAGRRKRLGEAVASAVTDSIRPVPITLRDHRPDLEAAAGDYASAVPTAIEAQVPRTRQAMLDLLHAASKAVADGRKNLDDEIAGLNELLKKPDIGPTTELERLLKARTSPTLIALLSSKDKEKRLAAKALAADLDEAIALAKPRDGIMSETSKALIADLKKSTNPELLAFVGWFQAQLAPIAEGGTVRIDPTGKKRSILPGTVDQAAAAKSLHEFMLGALKSADPFIQNDAEAEGQNFVAALSAEIESARSKRAAQLALEGLFAGVHIALNLGQIIDLVAGANVPTGTGHAEGRGPLRDSGGPVWAGFPFLKATRQAEVFVPGESGSILTLDQVKGMGGRTQNINIENVTLTDAHDEFSLTQQLQFLAAAG